MQRPLELKKEEATMSVLTELTSAFEGIASSRLAMIRNQVLHSALFFDDIWHMYKQLRVDTSFRFGRSSTAEGKTIDKTLFILITAEGGFSGDIDKRLIDKMLKEYNEKNNDIVVVGHHGAIQLTELGIAYKKYYKLPSRDQNINVTPLVAHVQNYKATNVFYQRYVSLTNQEIERIQLSAYVQSIGRRLKEESTKDEDTISELTYIFEPSVFDVIGFLESTMLNIAISQLILDSKLAQYASRFRAMSAAHEEAEDTRADLHLQFRRATRALKDERLKEIINTVRKLRVKSA